MSVRYTGSPRLALPAALLFALFWLAACAQPAAPTPNAAAPTPNAAAPGKLHVVATTNIVGDVVRQIGGDKIELTTLLVPGSDPHSYQATPDDLRRLNDAQVIFVNGLHLEEVMAPVLDNLDSANPLVSVNDGVNTRVFDADEENAGDGHDHEEEAHEEHQHEGIDPHTWMNPANVEVWSRNIAGTLGELDPFNAAAYNAAADAYSAELQKLDDDIRARFAAIPAAERKLVTDHDNLGYLADAYDFTVLGAVVPSLSTMASPSAQELAALQDQIKAEGARVILVGTTVNPATAQQMAQDTGAHVVTIYTDSLSDAAGPAATYLDMMRHNAEVIAAAFGQ